VPHIGTHLTPLGIYISIGKLDEVESILDVRLKILECNMHAWLGGIRVLELARESARDNRQSLRAEVLAELEELEESKSVALEIVGEVTVGECVVPTVLVEWTVLYRTHCVLPLITGF
jgi:hypothetical protein